MNRKGNLFLRHQVKKNIAYIALRVSTRYPERLLFSEKEAESISNLSTEAKGVNNA